MNNMIWRIKLVKPAKKQRSQPTSTSTELPKTVVVSVRTVNESETQNLGKEIENLLASGRTNTATIIKSNSTRIAESNTEQTENEYSPTKKHINTKENNSPLMPMEESVSAVEKKTLSSLPLTTSKVAEEITENQSKTTTSISTSKRLDTQKTDIDSSAQTATFQWVCMDIVRTIKVPYNGKEYDFIELTDGSLVWNENLEPYRKQQKLNVAENVLKYGTGGINIDESRVGTEGGGTHCDNRDEEGNCLGHNNAGKSTSGETIHAKQTGEVMGRFPANLIHDNSEEVRECFPETVPTSYATNKTNKGGMFNYPGHGTEKINDEGRNASRFFKSIIYNAKASKSERNKGCEGLEEKHKGTDLMVRTLWTDEERNHLSNVLSTKITDTNSVCAEKYGFSPALISFWKKGERIPTPETYEKLKAEYGLENELDYIIYEHPKELTDRVTILDNPTQPKSKNNHPTVKPIALMEYLIKMVTPKGGVVLDPFAGSGSTLVAAKENGFNYIGIEMTEEYIPIIEARLNSVQSKLL